MTLAVVCSHFNPAGFRAPRRNLMRFIRQCDTFSIPVFVAELVYDQDPFFVPDPYVFVRKRLSRADILWHKENLINIAVSNLPRQFTSVAWVDPDIWFMNRSWYTDAVNTLNERAIVQLFEEAEWTDSMGQTRQILRGCAADSTLSLRDHHPGFAWAARRALWDEGGGLCDKAILGGGDTLIVASCVNESLVSFCHYPQWREWLKPLTKWVAANGGMGYIPGRIFHEWHGEAQNRQYVARHEILKGIDIDKSIQHNSEGLLQFSPNIDETVKRRIVAYFIDRREDG